MSSPSTTELLASHAQLPQHVVYRSFVAETVVLNLRTGKYHGLNQTAGRMLEALENSASVGAAIPGLASEYETDAATIESDLVALCRELLDRGLIEIVGEQASS
jgi:Coenzyme PQQ synthesis protein D (PqqD)